MYVCQDFNGNWFMASDNLARHIDQETSCLIPPPGIATVIPVLTGTAPIGLRWAAHADGWRVVAYAEGGYALNRLVAGVGWCLCGDEDEAPDQIERALCLALGIAYVP